MYFFLCVGRIEHNGDRILSLESANKRSNVAAVYAARLPNCQLEEMYEVDTRHTAGPHAHTWKGSHSLTFSVMEYEMSIPHGRLFCENDHLPVQPVSQNTIQFVSCHPDDFQLLIQSAQQHGLLPPGHIYTINYDGWPRSVATNPYSPTSYALVTREWISPAWTYHAYVQAAPQWAIPTLPSAGNYQYQFDPA